MPLPAYIAEDPFQGTRSSYAVILPAKVQNLITCLFV
jgi:hypothetical protein